MRKRFSITLFAGAAGLALAACAAETIGEDREESADTSPIGATLSDKSAVAISDVPEGALDAAREARPDLRFTQAEREIRNGAVYYDVEGVDPAGDEVELDIMQDGESWRVVEVQRDIAYDETPAPVRAALEAHAPGVVPARIIESDQRDGVVIYEFFTRDADGREAKYEVKYEDGAAEFLEEEWIH